MAVWAWNSALSWVCGNTTIWKPSEKTPLCGIAVQNIVAEVFAKNKVPEGVNCMVQGGREVGEWLSNDTRIPLVSATGSTRMGKALSTAVAALVMTGNKLTSIAGYTSRVSELLEQVAHLKEAGNSPFTIKVS